MFGIKSNLALNVYTMFIVLLYIGEYVLGKKFDKKWRFLTYVACTGHRKNIYNDQNTLWFVWLGTRHNNIMLCLR